MYKAPPIVEAVLEFQLPSPVPMAALERARASIAKRLPITMEEQIYDVRVDADKGKVTVNSDPSGFRFNSASDNIETVIIRRNSMIIANQAPYKGWDAFLELILFTWNIFSKEIKIRDPLPRIGLRYINRLDIPIGPEGYFDTRDYLHFTYDAPQPPLNPSTEFLVSMSSIIGENDECNFRLSSSMTPSPLIGRTGLILDIDVFTTQPISSSDETLWPLVERMRTYKNSVFEACITDRARGMFANG